MSELQRSFAKAKLAGLPLDPPLPHPASNILHADVEHGEAEEDDVEEEDDALKPLPDRRSADDDSSSASSASSASSTGTIRPSPKKHLFARPKGLVFSPCEQCYLLYECTRSIYFGHALPANGKKPLDPIPWNDYFAQELYLVNRRTNETITHHVYITTPLEKGPLFVTHHGAGSSGLSFALFASEIHKALPNAGVLSCDARGHGETVVSEDRAQALLDLSLEKLSEDLVDVISMTQKMFGWAELPGTVLIGHSLGGAVVTDVAASGKLGNAVLGYGVLDVVEGSAIDALQSMQSYLSSRPKSFPSIASGIEWHTRSRTIRNSTSARISVPSLLRQERSAGSNSDETRPWTWRTDLAATQPFWEGWFVGLSKKFLGAKGGKLLLLAGTDRLDKELMIGQMQGKYQLQVVPEAGHFIQEDQAEKTAMVVVDFYRRNDRSALVLPPKVRDMMQNKQ